MSTKKRVSTPQERPGASLEEESQSEILLQMEYDTLTSNLSSLKRKVEKLRKEHEFLQNEVSQTRAESEEFISYLARREQKRQAAIVTQSDQSQRELQELLKQRKTLKEKHEEQASDVRKEILQMENQLAKLNREMADLEDVKILQQQQSTRIIELENELYAMQCHHSKTLVALQGDYLKKKKISDKKAEDNLRSFAALADKMASHSLMSYITEVLKENQHLHEVCESLSQRAYTLQSQQETLQTHKHQLLLEKMHVEKLHSQCFPQSSKTMTPEETT